MTKRKQKTGVRKQKTGDRSKKAEFEMLKIIGVISAKSIPKSIEKSLNREILKLKRPYVCLPFRVETRYLKNVCACMQLMDIEGIIVMGSHTKKMDKFIPNLDKSAKEAKSVNIIKRIRTGFKGYHFDQKTLSYREVVKFLTST